MAYPDIYHVTPMTPNAAMESVCADRNVLISMYDPRQLQRALRIADNILADHGRFSTWIAAMKAGKEWSDDDVPRDVYYRWLEPWIWNDNATAIMPDIPGAPSQLNDNEPLDWPFPIEKGLPVYHMDGPIARLARLLDKYPRVAMGWIGHPKREPVGCAGYWRRVEEIEHELGTRHLVAGAYAARCCRSWHASLLPPPTAAAWGRTGTGTIGSMRTPPTVRPNSGAGDGSTQTIWKAATTSG